MTLPIEPSDASYAQSTAYTGAPQSIFIHYTDTAILNAALNIVGLTIIISLVLNVMWRRRRNWQRLTLQQQREMLERMWQLSSTK